jgi:hypothetical protein
MMNAPEEMSKEQLVVEVKILRDLLELKNMKMDTMVTVPDIYAAWHATGIDVMGGDWNRFVKYLPIDKGIHKYG